jgi:hypothetical protein
MLVRQCGFGVVRVWGSDGGTNSRTGAGPVVDNAPAFVGSWTGAVTLIDPPTGNLIESVQATFVISEVMANTLGLTGINPDFSGPTATVTPATQFAIPRVHTCPVDTMETGCNSIQYAHWHLVRRSAFAGRLPHRRGLWAHCE